MALQQSHSLRGVIVSYELAAADSTMLIVDTRSAREYGAGHVPEAVSLPLADVMRAADDSELGKTFGAVGVGNHTGCVFYDDAHGAVASRVAMALESIGGSALLLDVTYSAWKKDHASAVSTAAHSPDPVAFKAVRAPAAGDILTSVGDVERAAAATDNDNDRSVLLLDARERLNYLSGHIPGAINTPYTMFKDLENGRILRAPGDLRRIFENRGIDADKRVRIITYCGSAGTLSGLVYYALRQAGFVNISMYANSFREWKARDERAVEVQQDANYWDLSAE